MFLPAIGLRNNYLVRKSIDAVAEYFLGAKSIGGTGGGGGRGGLWQTGAGP